MVLAILGCGFDAGGIPGATGAASLGTADDDGTASSDGGPTEGTAAPSGSGSDSGDPGPDATAGDPTTATGTPSSTSTTDATETTGEPVASTDTGSSTTATTDGGESSSDGSDIQDQPYYGDCTSDADCGDGDCAYFQSVDPDAAVCLLPCDQGVCPEPPDGQAEPICTATGDCALDCGAAPQGCPTGMSCYLFTTRFGSYSRCLWPQD